MFEQNALTDFNSTFFVCVCFSLPLCSLYVHGIIRLWKYGMKTILIHTHIWLHRTSGRMSENIYSFTAEANDNKARFRCEASNIMSQTPLKAEVDLTVMCKYLIIVCLAFG